eukprot:2073405-Rhodomonas_salina.1
MGPEGLSIHSKMFPDTSLTKRPKSERRFGRKTPDQHVEQLDFILIKERLHEGLCLLHLLSDLVHVTDMLYVSYKARSAEDLQ